MGKLAHAAERQEWSEAQGGGRVGVYQCIAYQDAVFVMLKDHFALQDDAAHPIEGSRHLFAVELADILMTLRTKIIALVLVQTQVKLRAVLYNRHIERGEEYVVLIVQLWNGDDQKAMVLTGVALYNSRAGICPRTVSTEQFLRQRLFEVSHKSFLKSKITHKLMSRFYLLVKHSHGKATDSHRMLFQKYDIICNWTNFCGRF